MRNGSNLCLKKGIERWRWNLVALLMVVLNEVKRGVCAMVRVCSLYTYKTFKWLFLFRRNSMHSIVNTKFSTPPFFRHTYANDRPTQFALHYHLLLLLPHPDSTPSPVSCLHFKLMDLRGKNERGRPTIPLFHPFHLPSLKSAHTDHKTLPSDHRQ